MNLGYGEREVGRHVFNTEHGTLDHNLEHTHADEEARRIEEHLLSGIWTDEEARGLLAGSRAEVRAVVGTYIGKTLDPRSYLQSFYECFPDLPPESRGHFIKRFTTEEPQFAICVAPFTNLAHRKDEYKYDVRMRFSRPSAELSVLEHQFDNFESALPLIEGIIAFTRAHREVLTNEDDRPITRDAFVYARNIEEIIRHFMQRHPDTLFPYLQELLDLGILHAGNDIAEILSGVERKVSFGEFAMTETERKTYNAYTKRSTEGRRYIHPHEDATMRALHTAVSTRMVEHMLKDPDTLFALPGIEKVDLLRRLGGDPGMPVFLLVEKLNCTKQEVVDAMKSTNEHSGVAVPVLPDCSDLIALLDWNARTPGEPDIERIVLKDIFAYLENGVHSPTNIGIVRHIKDVMEHLSEGGKSQLIASINARAPELWVENLGYAYSHEPIPRGQLFRACAQEPRLFLSHMHDLLSAYPKGAHDSAARREEIIATGRHVLSTTPHLVFEDALRGAIHTLIGKDGRDDFIKSHLTTPADHRFLVAVFEHHEEAYYAESVKLLEGDKMALGLLANNHTTLGVLLNYLGETRAKTFILSNADAIDLHHVLRSSHTPLLKYLAHDEHFYNELMHSLRQGGEVRTIGTIVTSARYQASHEDASAGRARRQWGAHPKTAPREHAMHLDQKKQYAQLATRAKTELIAHVARNPGAIFEDDLWGVLEGDGVEFIRRDIALYAETHPTVLFSSTYRHVGESFFVDKSGLSVEDVTRIAQQHTRAIAFSGQHGFPTHFPKTFSADFITTCRSINPLLDIAQREKLEKDYYATVLDTLRPTHFFTLYEKELKKIAEDELERNGPLLDPHAPYNISRRFRELVVELALLNSSPVAAQHADTLLSLPKKRRQEILGQLILLARSDHDNDLHIPEGADAAASIEEVIRGRVGEYFIRTFNLGDNMREKISLPSARTMEALLYFKQGTCRRDKLSDRALQRAIVPILNGTYESWRMWGDDVPETEDDARMCTSRLADAGLLPKAITPEAYASWSNTESRNFNELLEYGMHDALRGIRSVIDLARADGHIDNEVLPEAGSGVEQRLARLREPLELMVSEQEHIRSKQDPNDLERARYKELGKQMAEYKSLNKDAIEATEATLLVLHLQKLTQQEVEQGEFRLHGRRYAHAKAFALMEKTFAEHQEFLGDLRRIQELLDATRQQISGGVRVSRTELVVTDTVDLETYIRIGAEPVESCQHFNGGEYNAGLLSYVTDPAVRILQAREPGDGGKIIARAVLRMLEDAQGKPALFLERVYSSNPHPKISEVLVAFANQKAGRVGVRLYLGTPDLSSGIFEEPQPLRSRGTRAGSIYTDAGGGLSRGGMFALQGNRAMPPKKRPGATAPI